MKTTLHIIVFAAMFFLISSMGCSKGEDDITTIDQISSNEKAMQLINTDNRFSFELLKKVIDNSGINVMVSSLSVSQALSMTLNGAAGTTSNEMVQTLSKSGLTIDDINKIYLDLVNALGQADPDVVLQIANSIWIRQTFPVLDTFIDVNRKYYAAQVEKLAFDNTGLKTINSWVSQKTNGKIPQILDNISANDVMFLINAIYFNAKWHYQFDPKSTQDMDFSRMPEKIKLTVPTMYIKKSFGYSSQSTYSALKVPYGKEKFNMIIILPNSDKTVVEVANSLNSTEWGKLTSALKNSVTTELYLPRFKFSWGSKLNDVLSGMGMPTAFLPGKADFSGINKNSELFISQVIHKSFIDVNEAGTEAAAATSVGISLTSIGPMTNQFQVNRPFLFFITEEDTGAILFSGKVGNPLLTN